MVYNEILCKKKTHKRTLLTGRTTSDFRKLDVIVHIVTNSFYTFDM